jgi:hypothetical protein
MGIAIKRTLEYADNLEELASRLGVGTDKLQEWSFAAKQSGTDAERLGTFIERLATAAGDIKNLPGFQAMGINPAGMTPESLFGAVSSATRGKGSTEIVKMMEGVGLSIRQIGPMINVLAMDLDEAGESARNMGAVIDQQTVRALASLNDQLSIVGMVLKSQFAPVLIWAGKTILKAISDVRAAALFLGAISTLNPKDLLKFASGDKDGMSKEGNAKLGFARSIRDAEGLKLKALLDRIDNPPSSAPLPTIQPTGKEPKTPRGKAVASDSLVSVGNFLGASTRMRLETIAQQQLVVSRQQLMVFRSVDATLKTLTAARSMGFPT